MTVDAEGFAPYATVTTLGQRMLYWIDLGAEWESPYTNVACRFSLKELAVIDEFTSLPLLVRNRSTFQRGGDRI